MHYTPIHDSLLNQAEIEIGLFARPCLGRRRIPDLKTLRREARAWNRRINRAPTRINWRFDRRAPRRKFGYAKRFSKWSETRRAIFYLSHIILALLIGCTLNSLFVIYLSAFLRDGTVNASVD
ncbi:MAG: hypothetical protein JO189_00350 [Deltaproteobacteria bacterium]|nr:hypothetical protein [Deltaproteobacteria bacterium]